MGSKVTNKKNRVVRRCCWGGAVKHWYWLQFVVLCMVHYKQYLVWGAVVRKCMMFLCHEILSYRWLVYFNQVRHKNTWFYKSILQCFLRIVGLITLLMLDFYISFPLSTDTHTNVYNKNPVGCMVDGVLIKY